MIEITGEWLRDYATLALRVNRLVTESARGTVLIYRGPEEWRARAAAEAPRPASSLVEDADRLIEELPISEPQRTAYLAAQVSAMRAVARRQAGAELPIAEYARECLGVDAQWVPESLFEAAHARLDSALPATGGSLPGRLRAWQAAHRLADIDRLPGLVHQAVAECRARTSAIVALPTDEVVDCRLTPDAHFLAAGSYDGGARSTIHINSSIPFNLADLLYVVAHEGHPGHIAESLLKEIHVVDGQGRPEQQVRFMLSPSFVLSEGLGLHAQEIIFPGEQAQVWLEDNILSPEGIRPDGSDLAAIHEARNVLWGAWANAAFLAAEGHPDTRLADYLSRWALLSEAETAAALRSLNAPGMQLYVIGYFQGWHLLRSWLDAPDRDHRVRRLLTQQVLPADLVSDVPR